MEAETPGIPGMREVTKDQCLGASMIESWGITGISNKSWHIMANHQPRVGVFFRSETIRSPATIPILPGLEGISIPEYMAGLPACPLAALAEKEVPSPLRNEALASRWKTGGDQRWEVDQNSKNIWNPLRAD